jgi:hypothetical protein
MKRIGHGAVAAFLMLVMSCGINERVRMEAQSHKDFLDRITARVEKAHQGYLDLTRSPEYARLERYDQKYNWAQQFKDAQAEAASAQGIWAEIEDILDRNKADDEGRIRAKLGQLKERLKLAAQRAKAPSDQIHAIRTLMQEAPERMASAEGAIEQMDAILADLEPLVEKTLSDSRQLGWNKEKDIANRYAVLQKMATDAKAAQDRARAQFSSDDPDYVEMGEALALVSEKRAQLQEADPLLRERLDELGRSYTKRLIDMKTTYAVTIGRTSWNDYYDFPRETDYEYAPRPVDKTAFEYFSGLSGDIASGLRWVRPHISDAMWRKLRIDPGERVPRGDDSAVFWVSGTDIEYFHRYKILTAGQEKTTDWEEVDEEEYAYHLNNLGMDIQSKPFGMYASESIEEAAPPGMAYVGNEKYGSWQRDASGNSFWAFYGQYAFLRALLGGNRYSYNDWDTWNRDYRGRRPYYGRNPDGTKRYGSTGSTVRTDPNYRSSTFARSGGIRSAPASIRSAAGSARGRGPGSRGK